MRQGSFYVNEVQTSSLGKLLQALPLPVLLIDKGYRIIFANQACERISPAYEKVLGANLPRCPPIPLRHVRFNLWPQRSSQAENHESIKPSWGLKAAKYGAAPTLDPFDWLKKG